MSAEGFTDADVDLGARELMVLARYVIPLEDARREARIMLRALAGAGRLLPPGGARFQQWGVEDPDQGVREFGVNEAMARAAARKRSDLRVVVRDCTTYDDGSCYEQPWRPLTPEADQ